MEKKNMRGQVTYRLVQSWNVAKAPRLSKWKPFIRKSVSAESVFIAELITPSCLKLSICSH